MSHVGLGEHRGGDMGDCAGAGASGRRPAPGGARSNLPAQPARSEVRGVEPSPLAPAEPPGPERSLPAPAEPPGPEPSPAAPIDVGGFRASRPGPIDTRRHRLTIGALGLVLVGAFSVARLAAGGGATIGIPPGHRLPAFAAPLATSGLRGSPNTRPTCDAARHDPRALNVCLLTARAPVVLAFFVPRARVCVGQVDALQRLAGRFPGVAFAAVAVATQQATAARLAREHHWTIPVAYDRDGEVGALYGVAACPMVELARRGGVVLARLIGDRWASAAALGPRVRMLLRSR